LPYLQGLSFIGKFIYKLKVWRLCAAGLFDMSIDQIINYDGSIPKEVILEDKTELEQIRLIQQLEEEDKQTIFRLVEKMLTNKKFKDFFC
jgi:hypothetical protein